MIDLLLAARNLLRNGRRSFATFVALLLGTAAILLFGGYRKNIEYTMHTVYVQDGGQLQIQHRDLFTYGGGNPTKYSISGSERIIEAVKQDPQLSAMVSVATPTLTFGGIASNFSARVSHTVLGVGVVAADRNRMRAWDQFDLRSPTAHLTLEGSRQDGAIVGSGVARILLLCEALQIADCPRPVVADSVQGEALPADIASLAALDAPAATQDAQGGNPRIDLLASSPGGAPNVVSLEVLKAERQGFKQLDEVYLMMHLEQAQRLVFGHSEPKATAISVQLHDSDRMAEAKAQLEKLVANVAPGEPLAVRDFLELNPYFVQTMEMFDSIFGFIFALIGAIVLFTVGSTMSTAVMERTVEIGTIRALGVRRGRVQQMFLLEGLLLGVSGAITGAIVAIAASFLLNSAGLTWLPPGSTQRLPLLIIVWGETATILTTTFALSAVAVLSAWWPARRASRLVIVEALRHT
ncbi:ABC transporter permease [Rubrivivax gelatinosus]|nr:ABC transporter permease [Rubrivivax gelatinosus]